MAVSPEPPAVVASWAQAGIVAAVCATGTGSPLVTAVSTCVQVKMIFLIKILKMCIFAFFYRPYHRTHIGTSNLVSNSWK